MIRLGISLAVLSVVSNGLFTAPMKVIPRWKWENIWLAFILTSCLVMPSAVVFATIGSPGAVLAQTPRVAVACVLGFGFAWSFGAILVGLSVDQLSVSLANSMVLGVSSAMGSIIPLTLPGVIRLDVRQVTLFAGEILMLVAIVLCALAARAGGS